MSEQPAFDETVDFPSADASAAPKPALNLPEKSPLQLLDEIARGGMGSVLKGRDLDLGRDLAVKVLLEVHQGKPEMIQRFLEEARIAGQLQHPGIAPIHQLGLLPDGRPYFTMKLVKGQTLAALLAARTDVPEDRPRYLGVFAQVCQTLAYAHAHRVIHRDLKPSNVMVGAFGEVQVMDWGLAKVLPREGVTESSRQPQRPDISIISSQRGDGSSSAATGSYTQAGAVLGTPAYIAPEQARGDVDQIDERADVFGLGAILCEILTGHPPYTGTGTELVYKARTAKLDDAFARLDACEADAELIDLAKRCLAVESWDRPRDASVVAMEVTDYQQSVAARLRQAEMERAAAQIKALEERKRRKLTGIFAALGLLILGLGIGGWLWLHGKWEMRRAENSRAVGEALGQATSLREQARTVQGQQALILTAQAREQARRAEALVERGLTDQSLEKQVGELLEELKAEEKDKQLLAALDAARLVQAETNREERGRFALERAVPLYREALRAYGMPVGEGEAAAAVERLNKRPAAVRMAVLAALDDWIALAENPGWKVHEPHLPWLKAVLTAEKPEGVEKQVREAAAEEDTTKRRARLEKMAADADVEHLPAHALTRLAKRLSEVQAEASALDLLRRAQMHHVSDFWVNEDLGIMLLYQRPQEAVRYLTAATALRPDSAGAYNNLGLALEEQVNVSIRHTRSEQPNNNLGLTPGEKGKLGEAIAAYKKATELDPAAAPPRYNLALALGKQGKHDEFIAQLHKVLALDPKHARAHAALAHDLASQGKWQEAIAGYKKTIELDPKSAWPHNALGAALREQGKWEEAIAEFQKAIAINPKYDLGLYDLAYGNLVSALLRQGKQDAALVAYRKAVEHCPLKHTYWYGYTALCLYQGDKDAYRRCGRDMLARFGRDKHPITAERTAKACLLLPVEGEELKQASALADRAVAIEPSNPYFSYLPYFQLCKGLAEYRQGRLASAVSWLQKALSHPGSEWKLTIPAHLVLALAQHQRGKVEEARKSLAAAVRVYDEQHVATANEVDAWICQILRREAESEIPPATKKSHHE